MTDNAFLSILMGICGGFYASTAISEWQEYHAQRDTASNSLLHRLRGNTVLHIIVAALWVTAAFLKGCAD